MDVAGIAKASSSIAETGVRQDVDVAIQRRVQDIAKSTATQLVDAIQSVPTSNLPAHLGNNVNTTA